MTPCKEYSICTVQFFCCYCLKNLQMSNSISLKCSSCEPPKGLWRLKKFPANIQVTFIELFLFNICQIDDLCTQHGSFRFIHIHWLLLSATSVSDCLPQSLSVDAKVFQQSDGGTGHKASAPHLVFHPLCRASSASSE